MQTNKQKKVTENRGSNARENKQLSENATVEKKKFITNNVKMIFGGNDFILRSFLSSLSILRFSLSPPVLDLA